MNSRLDCGIESAVAPICHMKAAGISWNVKDKKESSNEDMILALAGQFKQLSHEPEKFR